VRETAAGLTARRLANIDGMKRSPEISSSSCHSGSAIPASRASWRRRSATSSARRSTASIARWTLASGAGIAFS
jgi:hypothetical protein